MQKEDLIKRLRLIAVITTTLLVVLVITLLVQFGFIVHNHQEIKRLQDRNTELQREIEGLENQKKYNEGDGKIDNPNV